MCSSLSSPPVRRRVIRVTRSLLPLLALTACGLGVAPQAHAVLDRSPSNAPDGISDVWAFIHDYDSGSNAADADIDGDGVSNRDEAGGFIGLLKWSIPPILLIVLIVILLIS